MNGPHARIAALALSVPTGFAQVQHFMDTGDPNDRLGSSLANAGDIDGDGVDDLVVGAVQRGSSGVGSGPGYVRVYSGADGSILMQANGDQNGDTFGYSVAGVGDFDGDGIGDVVVGAPQMGISSSAGGYARVVSGANGSTLRHVASAVAGDQAGRVVGGLGDVDGDGTPDFFVTAPLFSFNGIHWRGRLTVVSGATGGTLATHQAGENHYLGWRAFSGDFDDDSVRDYAAFANPPGAAPYVRVWSGATHLQIAQLPIRAKAQVGDHDGDGIDDFAWASDIFSGADGSLLIDFQRPFSSYPQLFADRPGGTGDYDGDGVLDLLAGSSLYNETNSAVFSGATERVSLQLGYEATTVCDLGDVDQDGYTDFVLGFARSTGTMVQRAGTVRVFRGAAPAPVTAYCSSGTLRFYGTSSFTNNDLTLKATHLPPGEIGLLILGDSQQDVPFGTGDLCVGGTILRIGSPWDIVHSDLRIPLDWTQAPFQSGTGSILPGDTRYFQFWYRTAAGFDLTSALSVTFGS